jgi:DNA-binding PadR family transcriptional regulator
MTLTNEQKEIAALTKRLKAGFTLTVAERARLESYRADRQADNSWQLLLSVFARTVALWLPIRQRIGDSKAVAAAVHERQRAYPTQGVRFAVQGDAATRQGGWRALRKLATDGLLTIHDHRFGGKGVRLTLPGWEHAAEGAPHPNLRDTLGALGRLAELSERSTIAPWVAEVDLEPGASDWGALSGWQEQAEIVEENLLLALASGWAVSLSDTCGRVLYRITDEGRHVLENPPTLPNLKLPELTQPASEFYCEQFAAAWNDREQAAPSRPGLLPPCPLPASFIPHRAKRFSNELADGNQAADAKTKTNAAQSAAQPPRTAAAKE